MVLGWDEDRCYVNPKTKREVTVYKKTSLQINHIDLARVVIRTSALETSGAQLLPMAMLTPYMEHREVLFLHDLLKYKAREFESSSFLSSGTEISNYYIIGTSLMRRVEQLV